jgi:hypothetical protein
MNHRLVAGVVATLKTRVLVLDEETVAGLATNALTKAGFETGACSNPNSASAAVETGGADVVIRSFKCRASIAWTCCAGCLRAGPTFRS